MEQHYPMTQIVSVLESHSQFSPTDRLHIQDLCTYSDVFVLSERDTVFFCDMRRTPLAQGMQHLSSCPLVVFPFHKRVKLGDLLDDLLARAIISRSNSPWAAQQCWLVRKSAHYDCVWITGN